MAAPKKAAASVTSISSRRPAKKAAPRKSTAAKKAAPPAAPKPLTLNQALETGDYLEILKAQRREMVAALKSVTAAPLAALHRQIAVVSKEIEALEATRVADPDPDADDNASDDEAFDPDEV